MQCEFLVAAVTSIAPHDPSRLFGKDSDDSFHWIGSSSTWHDIGQEVAGLSEGGWSPEP